MKVGRRRGQTAAGKGKRCTADKNTKGGRVKRVSVEERKRARKGIERKEERNVKDYQKVLLLVWPKLEKLTEFIGQYAQAKAYASFSGRETSEQCVQKILDYLYIRDCFTVLREQMGEVFAKLSREELYLLEYKYFRRKRKLEGEFAQLQCNFCERTYYRRQRKLGEKLNSLFLQRGMDENWFFRTFSSVPYMQNLLERVKRAGVLSAVDKRCRGELHVSDAARIARPRSHGI